MNSHTSDYYRSRFLPEIISHAIWLYHRFCLSVDLFESGAAPR